MTFQFYWNFSLSDIPVLGTFQWRIFLFWWHSTFDNISLLVTFQFWRHFSVGDLSVFWHFSFGDISVLVTFQFWWHFSFGDILSIPTAKSVDMIIPNHGVRPNNNKQQTTTNNTPNIEPLQIFVGLVGIWVLEFSNMFCLFLKTGFNLKIFIIGLVLADLKAIQSDQLITNCPSWLILALK